MQFLTSCVLLLLFIDVCITAPTRSPNACGYATCNLGDPNKINVHLVPHSHDDVGFVKTLDQYYYGAGNDIQEAAVQYILDSIVLALDENPDRRFIYAEMAFFWRWWLQQTEDIRDKVTGFVNDGRLEFVSGGWSMIDEATTHYSSIIDQHTLGAQFLADQFGDCARPRVGWQIDPFGHSREVASLFAQMGFDGLFVGRIDYQDYEARNRTKSMEMVWKASANLGDQSYLFTSILPHRYSTPTTFCFDYLCEDEPIMDDVHLHDYNVPERVQAFIQTAQNQALGYSTNHIIMTFGGDFQYRNALSNFKNLDKLIKYVNAQQSNGSNVNVFYSTPSCYLYALNKVDRVWTSKSDDFFPYAMVPHGYWTGYFTSRTTLKRYERHANTILQITKQLNAFANIQLRNSIFYLSEAMGVLQHHDAVTGTSRQNVAFDYAQRLSEGIRIGQDVINQAYAKLLPKPGQPSPPTPQILCELFNISQCPEIDGQERFTLTLWNPTIQPLSHNVRVPVRTDYTVRDPAGQYVLTELFPISEPVQNIPGRTSVTQKDIIFKADLPALGFNTYYFEKKPGEENGDGLSVEITQNAECILENQNIRVVINDQGNLVEIVNKNQSLTLPFTSQGIYWYEGYPNPDVESNVPVSGAYVFRPFNQTAQPVSTTRTVTCIKGQTVQTAVIVFNEWASQEINLYEDAEVVDLQWTVGPIPVDDDIGKEIVIRYDTDIQNEGKYYTDANGREVLERTRNYRPTWNYSVDEPVSGNYYPINSRIWINDQNRQLTVLTGRSHGGGSIRDGSIEIMVHRRLVYDDKHGVGEVLNETAYGVGLVVRGRHVLILQPPSLSARYHRVASQRLYMHPLATYSLVQQTYDQYSAAYRQTWSALTDTLPLNVHLLTLDQLTDKDYLVRVENYFALYEDNTYGQPVTFDLQAIFRAIGTITNMVELTLNANLPLANLQRLSWVTGDQDPSYVFPSEERSLKDTTVRLTPMQIRTFQVTVA